MIKTKHQLEMDLNNRVPGEVLTRHLENLRQTFDELLVRQAVISNTIPRTFDQRMLRIHLDNLLLSFGKDLVNQIWFIMDYNSHKEQYKWKA